MHDIFCMHIGQCGLQIGFALWELLVAEHGIGRDGRVSLEDVDDKQSYNTFFNVSASAHYVPRSLFVDLEPTVIDQMRKGSFRELFHPDQLINGNEDAANNFARGFHTVGRIMKRTCENRIRKEFEISDQVQGIHIYRSLGGGTGSGMTATLFETLLQYPKTSKIEIPINPSPHLSCAIVEPYNCILSEHFCMDDIDIGLLMDNESLYDIMNEHMHVKEPILHQINRIVAQVCSSLTASSRFENELYNDFTILTNLVPYPRIHFPLVSYSPFGCESKINHESNTVAQITHDVFDSSNQLVKCDPISGKYMSCSLVYRGEVSPPQVFNALAEMKSCRFVRFVDWCPTGFKVGIVNQPPQILAESLIGYSRKNVVMVVNNSSVSSLWHRLAQKFHKLYSKRSFVHWFVAEGLEESEFCESLYNIATLAKDYEEVALDTNVEDFTASGKEGLHTSVENKPHIEKSETDDADDGADDNENVSNMIKPSLNFNTNQTVNWREKFEDLLETLERHRGQSKLQRNPIETESIQDGKIQNGILLTNDHCSSSLFDSPSRECDDPQKFQNSQNTNALNFTDLSNDYCLVKEYDLPQHRTDNGPQENAKFGSGELWADSLLLCNSYPPCSANAESLINVKCEDQSPVDGTKCFEDERMTSSLMESLIRLTSAQ